MSKASQTMPRETVTEQVARLEALIRENRVARADRRADVCATVIFERRRAARRVTA